MNDFQSEKVNKIKNLIRVANVPILFVSRLLFVLAYPVELWTIENIGLGAIEVYEIYRAPIT